MKTISTREERANNIMEAQNRNLQIFAEALESGSIMVDWDNDSGLNVLYGIDCVRKMVESDD